MKKLLIIFTLLISFNVKSVDIHLTNGCTFQDAIISANTGVATGNCPAGAPGALLDGQDIIIFEPNSVITLTEPIPNINNHLIIQGNNSVLRRDPNAPNFSVFPVIGANMTIYDMSFTGGVNLNNQGGGIQAHAWAPRLHNVKVYGNVGGGIWSGPSVELYNSEVFNNVGVDGADFYGSGITSAFGGTILLENSTVSNNSSNSLFSGGGGIYAPEADVIVRNSTISGNSTLNEGGGIYTAPEDGGGNLTIENSTIINNTSGLAGGGIYTFDVNTTISQSLITGNTAENDIGNNVRTILGNTNVDDYNLFGANGESGIQGFNLGASDIIPGQNVDVEDIVNLNLSDNGGLTRTHNLVFGGPAIDRIFQNDCANDVDQSGKNRPLDGDNDGFGECDIGSFEYIYVDLIFKDAFEFPFN